MNLLNVTPKMTHSAGYDPTQRALGQAFMDLPVVLKREEARVDPSADVARKPICRKGVCFQTQRPQRKVMRQVRVKNEDQRANIIITLLLGHGGFDCHYALM